MRFGATVNSSTSANIAWIDVVAHAGTTFSVPDVAEPHLAQVISALLVVSALRHLLARVGAGHLAVEVGAVVGWQPTTHRLLFLPQTKPVQLRTIERIIRRREGLAVLRQNLFGGSPLRSRVIPPFSRPQDG